ncbi:pimeloyl-ACP methyl ester carboxylesterase [Pseudoduganella lurida]|uniref:Pimeloyl-ACP methyl ester carboxylesterase n=1 Tax=Pseudoduganella lurida TaxID=1036180 RepID=A0A562QY94_9BURK|nr:alpha/beta hydrolase [Pseudoduganella lurida]TWI61106.1 pimeloyl-ACP methyl ester carboxylesterase [Pseudoduganella lurida]
MSRLPIAASVLSLLLAGSAAAATYGPELQGFPYPHPQQHFRFDSQGQALQMAYMDVPAAGQANGRVAVLMHGKNFCGATWEATITALTKAGYRVIAPDQIGFCASTKPAHYQYSFQQLAANTLALLKKAGVDKVVLVGHSTGGMLATRFALMYPQAVSHLVMVNPIGLEDWQQLGVPWRSVDAWYERELKLSADSVRSYEKSTYYVNRWKPEYEKWVDMLAGLNAGPGHRVVAWNSALLYDMIYTQPVVHEFPQLKVPVTLMIGDADTTAIGSDIAPPDVKAKVGNYKVLGKAAVQRIPQGKLVEFPGLGHAPQIEDPAGFHKALLQALGQ